MSFEIWPVRAIRWQHRLPGAPLLPGPRGPGAPLSGSAASTSPCASGNRCGGEKSNPKRIWQLGFMQEKLNPKEKQQLEPVLLLYSVRVNYFKLQKY